MSNAKIYNIDPIKFNLDPYPDLKAMRRNQPISFVPELGATLMTLRDDIFINEKLINVFSSDQPDGLMTRLMGTNMMRKDGEAHKKERQATFKSFSPRTVQDVWKQSFVKATSNILDSLRDKNTADLVTEFAMPVSAEALKVVTGLENMNSTEMDRVSQGMIDGVANYSGNIEIENNCQNCTASIDYHIDDILPKLKNNPDNSLISVQLEAGLSIDQLRANIKLAISGGQNEPRDAIAGTACTLLQYPDQLKRIINQKNTWLEAFEEFGRWMSPIGMSPRRAIKEYSYEGVEFYPDDKVFFMFGSANRDETIFDSPEIFNIERDTSLSITFGAGPHFCAGSWISKVLIAEVALPMLFARLPELRLEEDITFSGWAFRGLKSAQVSW